MRSSSLPLRALVVVFASAALAACAASADGTTSPIDAATGATTDGSLAGDTGAGEDTASPGGGGGGGGGVTPTGETGTAPEVGAPPGTDGGAGGLCPAVASCTADEDCQTGCPSLAAGDTWCCDSNLCYTAAGTCPVPGSAGDGGTGY